MLMLICENAEEEVISKKFQTLFPAQKNYNLLQKGKRKLPVMFC